MKKKLLTLFVLTNIRMECMNQVLNNNPQEQQGINNDHRYLIAHKVCLIFAVFSFICYIVYLGGTYILDSVRMMIAAFRLLFN